MIAARQTPRNPNPFETLDIMNTVSLPVIAATPAPQAGAAAPPTLTPRLATGLAGMLIASLLAILNEQVTAAAMADIRGAFSIGHDDGTWLTALFEAANVATMVFAPWFGVTFTLKRFTIGAVLATLILGVLCPFAPGFAALTVLRVLQGIAGGCLPPMLIIAALRYLPPKAKLYGRRLRDDGHLRPRSARRSRRYGPNSPTGAWRSGRSCRSALPAARRSAMACPPIHRNPNGSARSTGPDS